jgi:hypothetical protein
VPALPRLSRAFYACAEQQRADALCRVHCLKTKLRPLWNSNPWFDSYCLLFDSPHTLLNLFSLNSSLLLVTPDLSHGTVGFGRQAEECVEELVALAI